MSTFQAIARSLKEALWAPGSVFCFYAVAAKGFDAYLKYPDLDMPTHFAGGFVIAYFFLRLTANFQPVVGKIPRVAQHVLALGLTGTMTVIWEFFEFSSDYLLNTHMQLGVQDTMSDMFFGLLGGTVFLVGSYARKAGRCAEA